MMKRGILHVLFIGACMMGNVDISLGQEDEAFSKGTLYTVKGVSDNDQLNMRIDPRSAAWVISRIPPNTKDVMSTGRLENENNQRWVFVYYNGVTGWVNSRFLRAQPALSADLKNTFFGRLVLEPQQDGRNMRIVNNVGYIDNALRKWEVPAGTVTDGASIPRPLWSIIGSPFTGKYLRASVLHDRFVTTKFRSWADTHQMFYDVMLADGVDRAQATLMWAGVYRFGPRWTKNEATCWNGCAGADVLWVDVRIEPEFSAEHFEELKSIVAGNPMVSRDELLTVISKQVRGLDATAKISGVIVDFMNVPYGERKPLIRDYKEALKYATSVKGVEAREWSALGDDDRERRANFRPSTFSTKQ